MCSARDGMTACSSVYKVKAGNSGICDNKLVIWLIWA